MYSYTIPSLPIPNRSAEDSDYFVFRGNSKFRPEPGVHYDPNLILRYLTAGVVESINTLLQVSFPGQLLVDYRPGIGQLTLKIGQSFPRILAIEDRPQYYPYLLRNVASYTLDDKVLVRNRVSTVDGPYVLITYSIDNVPIEYTNPVARVFVLPQGSVLPENIRLPDKDFMNVVQIADCVVYVLSTSRLKRVPSPPTPIELTPKLREFIEYAKSQLSGLVDDANSDAMFGPSSYQTWNNAITHKSVDPINNYEMLEYEGDLILKPCFTSALIEIFPDLTEQEATNLNSQYMSKRGQGPMARQLKLNMFLRTNTNDKKQDEDIFESFFGAIYRLGERIRDGVGYGYARGFMRNIVNSIRGSIKRELGAGDPKTILEQRISQLTRASGKVFDVIREKTPNNKKITTLTIKPAFARELPLLVNPNSKPLPIVIGYGEGKSRAESEQSAYASALKVLDDYGITAEFTEQRYESNLFSDPEFEKYQDQIHEKLQQMNIKSVESEIVRTDSTDIHRIQLVGIKQSGEKVVLGEGISGSQGKAFIQAVAAFLHS